MVQHLEVGGNWLDFLLRSLAVIVKVGGSGLSTFLNREDEVEGIEVNPGGNLMSVPRKQIKCTLEVNLAKF